MDYVIAKNRYNTHGDTIVPFAATHAIELRSKEQRNIIKIKKHNRIDAYMQQTTPNLSF